MVCYGIFCTISEAYVIIIIIIIHRKHSLGAAVVGVRIYLQV